MNVILNCYIVFLAIFSSCIAMETVSTKDSITFNVDQGLYQQLLRRVDNLEKRDQDQQAEIDSLQEELNTEKVKTSRLEGRLSRLLVGLWKRHGDTDDNHVHVVEDAMFKHQSEDLVSIADEDTAEGKRSPEAVGERPSRIQRQAGTPVVAFHAHLGGYINHAGVHQIIIFDGVQTNIGNAYNPHFGSFIAPVSGVYVFHTTMRLASESGSWIVIVKNGAAAANLWTSGRNVSGMLVVHLNKDDDVAVRNELADKDFEGNGNSMFSGFLLRQDGTDASIVG